MDRSQRYLVPLRELDREDRDRAGAKAATLAHLLRAGYPVPEGFVLTVEAFERWREAGRSALPQEVSTALGELARELGDVALAVRSSGVVEDGHDRSCAGQYETILDVRGGDLHEAVARCWASAFGERARAYLGGGQRDETPALAVLIQPLVRAEAAGVAFTANPVTGDRREILVSAVRGLGDRLVSGQATPDEWTVRDRVATRRSVSEHAVDEGQVLGVAELAKRAERTFGQPQDVEWALARGRLYLLQSRPITALPAPALDPVAVPVVPPPGFWEREASHAPLPHTPMNRSLIFAARNDGMRRCFASLGALPETLEFREIGGWEYLRLVPPGGKDRPAPPAWLFRWLTRLSPYMRSRIAAARRFIRNDEGGTILRRWYDEERPRFARRIAALRDVALPELADADLDRELGDAVDLLHEGLRTHFLLHGAIAPPLAELAFTCRDLLGWPEERTFELLNGLSTCSTEPAEKLAEIAAFAAGRPAVSELLDRIDRNTPRRLAAADPELGRRLEDYQRTYGCRALRYEVADPTLAEEPQVILSLLRDQLARKLHLAETAASLERARRESLDQARRALAGRPEPTKLLERVVERARLAYPVREDNEFYTVSAPLALARYRLLELGRRLATQGRIDATDDVFFLEIDEAREALSSGVHLREQVRRRRGEHAWVKAHPGPASYGTAPGPPPSFDVLPPEARLINEAVIWTVERVFEPERSGARQESTGSVIRGLGASRGRYRGRVRVIPGESEFGKLRDGDVLVCPITSPVWSVLFSSVGAVVTDTGGVLSHSAIIAREYGIPAVVATGNATALLQDDQIVTVDGEAGVIEIEGER